MLITSKSNPLIKSVQSLYDKKFRKLQGEYIVEGVKLVKECISAGCNVRRIICVEQLEKEFVGATLVSQAVFKSISDEITPQGVLAVVEMPQTELTLPIASCLLLDCIQDPGNLGTVIRTANAAGYGEIYLINCTDPYSPKSVRASMGGIFHVNIYRGDREQVLKALGGMPLICADMNGENIFKFVAPERFCLCIGNEGSGISEQIKTMATHTVRIPMRDTCESLNAGVSAGIAMYVLKN